MRPRRAVLFACLLTPCLALAAPEGAKPSTPAATPTPAPRRPQRIKVAVTEISILGAEARLAEVLPEVALTEASSVPRVDAIGRGDVLALLSFERQKQLLGCTEDAACLAEIGGALGVDYLLVGTVGKVGTLHRVDLRLIEARRARVVGRVGESVDGGVEKVVAAVQRGVRRLLEPVAPAGPPAPVAARPSRTPAWIALGAGGMLLAAVGGLAVKAKQERDDLASLRGTYGYADAYASKSDRVKGFAATADVLVGVGLVTAGVGAWLWWRARPDAPVAVLPAVGPGTAGLVAAGSF